MLHFSISKNTTGEPAFSHDCRTGVVTFQYRNMWAKSADVSIHSSLLGDSFMNFIKSEQSKCVNMCECQSR